MLHALLFFLVESVV